MVFHDNNLQHSWASDDQTGIFSYATFSWKFFFSKLVSGKFWCRIIYASNMQVKWSCISVDIGVDYTVWVVHNSRILQGAESLTSTWMKMKTSWISDDVYVGFCFVVFSSAQLILVTMLDITWTAAFYFKVFYIWKQFCVRVCHYFKKKSILRKVSCQPSCLYHRCITLGFQYK